MRAARIDRNQPWRSAKDYRERRYTSQPLADQGVADGGGEERQSRGKENRVQHLDLRVRGSDLGTSGYSFDASRGGQKYRRHIDDWGCDAHQNRTRKLTVYYGQVYPWAVLRFLVRFLRAARSCRAIAAR